MEVSSGEEYYIASDNTGTPLAVFSSNGQMIKQVIQKRLYLQTLTATKFVVKLCGNNMKSAYGNGSVPKASLYKTLNPYQLQGGFSVPDTLF